jgi:DNA-binding protein YbaB
MFDNLKGMASAASLLKDLPKLKAQMETIKARLGEVMVEAETGGGAVRVVANGKLRVISINLDEAMLAGLVGGTSPDDRAMAEDLISGAVNAALTKAREAAEAEVRRAASELGLPIPPAALDGLMGP